MLGMFRSRDLPLMYWEHEAPKSEAAGESLEATEVDVHLSHCATCFRSECDHFLRPRRASGKRNGTTIHSVVTAEEKCHLIACSRCGVKMHACKEEEHLQEVCPEVVVPCINADNGCDTMLKRRLRGVHLEKCPASIIFCSVEWNRWPLHYTDKHSPLPFFLPNPQGTPDQLDIALALRDQAMLNAAYSSPRHFRRMRNDLTERFPAVPLPQARPVPESILKSRQLTQMQNGSPNGKRAGSELSNGVSAQLSRDGSIDSDAPSVLTSEEDFSWSDAPWQKQRSPPGLSRSMCSKLYQATRQTSESLKAALQMITGHEDEGIMESASPVRNGVNGCHSEDQTGVDPLKTEVYVSGSHTSSPDWEVVDHQEISGRDGGKISNGSHISKSVPTAPPPHVPVALGLNLTVEAITRYQAKPKSMLTFVCGHIFRRSEYASHYKNVHSEIQGALTWVEQRCPLAQYGCPFSLRRLSPAPVATITHSSDLQCFGVKRPYCDALDVNLTKEDFLTSLPPEVLTRVGGFLDGYALNSLSRTNRRLRFLCASLLEHQGMVHQEWIPTHSASGWTNWKIGFQRWTFSAAFDEIRRWRLGDESSGQHLAHCPFYHAVRQVNPVKLLVPDVKPVTEEQLEKLKATANAYRYCGTRDQIVEPCFGSSSVEVPATRIWLSEF